MKSTKIVFALLAIVTLAGLIFFLNQPTQEPQAAKQGPILIGVIEPMAHIAVSDITKGITDELNSGQVGQFKVIVKNANGDKTVIPQIIAQFKDAGVQFFVPIFTGTAQAVKSSVKDKPVC